MQTSGDIACFTGKQTWLERNKGNGMRSVDDCPGVAPVCASRPEGMSIAIVGAGWLLARSINAGRGSRGAFLSQYLTARR